MSDPESDGLFENDWNETGDLVWNEFDWERYLRAQDDILHRYLGHYESLKDHPDRIDEAARLMGWDAGTDADDHDGVPEAADASAASLPSVGDDAIDPYTLHKHPVYIATRAIYLSLKRGWERIAVDPGKVPQRLALVLQASLHRGEEHALIGAHALDLGDYAMAVSLFKRALEEINRTLALAADPAGSSRHFAAWRDDAQPRLFDLREIWLRVMSECREEMERRVEDTDGDEG